MIVPEASARRLAGAMLLIGLCSTPALAKQPDKRTFELTYGGRIQDLPEDARVRVWLPVPQSDAHQSVQQISSDIPGELTTATERTYGNEILYFEPDESGDVDFRVTYLITRSEVRGLSKRRKTPRKLSPKQEKLFLSANQLVPLGGKPQTLIDSLTLSRNPLELGKQLYLRTEEHMRYDKSRPGYGKGDAVWACDSRFGNCTDFHSLFIALARSSGLPARFEIGFPLPKEHGAGAIAGYHCWAEFFVDNHGWVPVDISEADKHPDMKDYYFGNLTPDRVAFTIGRDLELVPRQEGPPLNYFINPYVEVDGKPWSEKNIELSIAYKDRTETSKSRE